MHKYVLINYYTKPFNLNCIININLITYNRLKILTLKLILIFIIISNTTEYKIKKFKTKKQTVTILSTSHNNAKIDLPDWGFVRRLQLERPSSRTALWAVGPAFDLPWPDDPSRPGSSSSSPPIGASSQTLPKNFGKLLHKTNFGRKKKY